MALVILAAALQALLFLLFRSFEERRIPLMPAIAVNYMVATLFGVLIAPPWLAGPLGALWLPSAGVGILFVLIFFLTGITAQRDGVAASTVASKMSVVLTVLFSVLVHHEIPGILGWTGLMFAVSGVVLASWAERGTGIGKLSWFPLVLFIGTACIDVSLNVVQRNMLNAGTHAVFPTMCTAIAGALAFAIVVARGSASSLARANVWFGGGVLGLLNYATLYFVVQALANSGMQASIVFPLISVGVILLGTLGSMVLFRERLTRTRTVGIGFAVIAVTLLILAH